MRDGEAEVLRAVAGRRAPRSGWLRVNCPFCLRRVGKEDRKRCLSFNASSGGYHCFRCSTKGRIGDVPDFQGDAPAQQGKPKLPEHFVALSSEDGRLARSLAPQRQYLARRGVDAHMIRRAGIGAVPSHDDRIVVPIHRDNGALAGWVSRTSYADGQYRYMPGMNRDELLYNGRAVHVETDAPLLVVEGVLDTFPFFPDAVALLGKPDLSHERALLRAKRPIVVVLDGDAWREGAALALTLRLERPDVYWVDLAPRVDPDEAVDEVAALARLLALRGAVNDAARAAVGGT